MAMAAHLYLAPSPAQAGSTSEVTTPIRVVLADGHAFMRSSLRQLLEGERNIAVIAEAQDLPSTMSHVHSDRPHVLALDLSLPEGSGLDAIGELRERAPDTQIVVLTMDDSPMFAQRALAAGAVGLVLKNHADSELSEAVRAAARDEEYVSPRVADRLQVFRHSLTEGELSVREVEVLRLIALGYTSVEIARKLHLSPRMIETHRAHIHGKLASRTRSELVRYALRRGLLRA
jgi:two-component system, NarL family, response regulator NreC